MTCPTGSWTANAPNPHVLTGTLVNGPQQPNDMFTDRRQNPNNGVAIVYNAGYTGAALWSRPIVSCCTRLALDLH